MEVTDARVLIEMELIRRAIEKGDDDWEIAVISTLHRLKRIEQRDPEHPLRDPEWKIAHRQFHQALVSACGSATLLAIRADRCSIAPNAIGNLSANFRPQPRDKAGEHQAIMQAAIARNADLAVQLIERAYPHDRQQRREIRRRICSTPNRPQRHFRTRRACARDHFRK